MSVPRLYRESLRVLLLLAALNAVVLLSCQRFGANPVVWVGCYFQLILNWPAFLLLPDEADELLGRGVVIAIGWFASLPWLAFCSVIYSLARSDS